MIGRVYKAMVWCAFILAELANTSDSLKLAHAIRVTADNSLPLLYHLFLFLFQARQLCLSACLLQACPTQENIRIQYHRRRRRKQGSAAKAFGSSFSLQMSINVPSMSVFMSL